MSEMLDRVARRLQRLRERGASSAPGGEHVRHGQQLKSLRARVNELEQEVIENRQLARRIAELTDVVEQLLLPEEVRDPRRLEERLGQIRARH